MNPEIATGGARIGEGAAQPYGVSSSYSAWREVWRTLLGVSGEPSPSALIDQLTDVLPAVLLSRLPLFGTLLGVRCPTTN